MNPIPTVIFQILMLITGLIPLTGAAQMIKIDSILANNSTRYDLQVNRTFKPTWELGPYRLISIRGGTHSITPDWVLFKLSPYKQKSKSKSNLIVTGPAGDTIRIFGFMAQVDRGMHAQYPGVTITTLSNREYQAVLRKNNDTTRWWLNLHLGNDFTNGPQNRFNYSGTLTGAGSLFKLHSVNQMSNGKKSIYGMPMGFEIKYLEHTLGAIQYGPAEKDSRVWLAKDAESFHSILGATAHALIRWMRDSN